MTIAFPDGLVVLVLAGDLEPSSLAYFPDGERYAIMRVDHIHGAGAERVRIEGRLWSEWQDGVTRRPRRAQCTLDADEVVPVVQPPFV